MSAPVVDTGAGTESRVHLVSGRPLFFPFPSGTISYSCEGCDAPCCKGEPLGIGRSRELVTILQAQPRAALFATPGFNGGPLMSLSPPPEKCWFLDRKQRCRLEYVLGREQKPTGCRLFPFSILTGLGETLAIMPDLLCPVTTSPPSLTGDFSHDALAFEMARTQVPRSGHLQLDDPPDLSWDEAIGLERRIVVDADAALRRSVEGAGSGRAPSASNTFVAFCEVMHQRTAAVWGVDVRPSAMALVDADTRRFLGADDPLSVAATQDLLTFVGVLRLRPIDGATVSRRALPALLTALSVLVASYDGMRGSRRSVRSLAGLWDTQGPVLYSLAHLGARPLPKGDAILDDVVAGLGPLRPAFSDLIEGIRHNGRRSIAITVEELLRTQRESFAPPLTVDAVGMLHSLGRVLREACTFTPI
jgi:Fe-S-cluster containining protein